MFKNIGYQSAHSITLILSATIKVFRTTSLARIQSEVSKGWIEFVCKRVNLRQKESGGKGREPMRKG